MKRCTECQEMAQTDEQIWRDPDFTSTELEDLIMCRHDY